MQPKNMSEVIGGVLYDTETAALIARNDCWDGSNYERHGRNCFLYRGRAGTFFLVRLTMWQGERDHIEPLTLEEAKEAWDRLPERVLSWLETFGEVPAEA